MEQLSAVNPVILTSYKKLEEIPAATAAGNLNGKSVSSVPVDANATRLTTHDETQQKETLKDKLLAGFTTIGNKFENWFNNLFSSSNSDNSGKPQSVTPQAALSAEQLMGKMALELIAEKGFSKLNILENLSAAELKDKHNELASGNGALRSTATDLRCIQQFGSDDDKAAVSEILKKNVAGIPFQQWATTGSTASTFVEKTSAEDLQSAAEALNEIAKSIAELAEDFRNYLNPNVDSAALGPQTEITTQYLNASQSVANRYEKDHDLGVGGGRSAQDSGRSSALDAISLLSMSVAPSKQVHISSDTINNLQDAISSDNINFYQIKDNAVSFGDLQLLRELALSTNPQNNELNGAGNLGASINELSSTRPNISNILTSVRTFIEESNQAWATHNVGKPEQLMDAVARSAFNQGLITTQLDLMPNSYLQQAYEQLDGAFGDRIRGVIDVAVEKVTFNVEDPVMISTAVKYSTVIEGMIDCLNLKLNPGVDKPIPPSSYISNTSQLTPLEKAALSRVGITKQILEE
ncbi:hypothetical protein HQQ94_00550 [Shewanella sp. VB17]|uniref:hypothetical protein n=1 Tax=Shewanella sp. VB17 TaxID=2739432 RepID=UPI001564E52F|nr:hypothetical protein [Shewanella sp. VB17]NRD71765.1 hypothetical protein [Shewanella sp. VB17]